MNPAATPTGVRRATVEANRQRLLTAAEGLFAERGLAVTLNDVAHRAGVGVGTAYRRFANKDELIDAVFDRRLDEVAALAQECLGDPDPWHGLASYLERSLQMEVGDRSLSQMVHNSVQPSDRRITQWRDRLAPLLEQLVQRAKDSGALRPDVVASDAIYLKAALTSIIDMSRHDAPDIFRRYLTVVLDGLRARPGLPSALPVPPVSTDTADADMAAVHWRAGGHPAS